MMFYPRLKHSELCWPNATLPSLRHFPRCQRKILNASVVADDRLHQKAADKSSTINPVTDPSSRASALTPCTFNKAVSVE